MDDAKLQNEGEAATAIDPSTIDKTTLNPNADEKNFVALTGQGKPYLACGAYSRNKKKGDRCHMAAGQGTAHKGYGRCKYHGGNNTGPITEEGKAIASQNARKHGFYAEALSREEREIYEGLVDANVVGLEHEIFMLKAKILAYLKKWRAKWDNLAEREGEDVADTKTRVLTKESDGGNAFTYSYYHAGTIEDKPLMRALETLGRLIEKHARLNQGGESDVLVNQINAELRAASYGQVSVSWGTAKPQTRSDEGGGDYDE